jgi:pyruvate/2-oxoglutarate dehydrogenase complex dihydrolipoamide acyltransferase (E2) component
MPTRERGAQPASEETSWRKISLSAWGRPHDPSIYGWLELDVSRALRYLEELGRANSVKLTLTHLVGKALACALADCPDANVGLRRQHVFRRASVDVFFQVAYEHGANLSGAKLHDVPAKSLLEIARELEQRAEAIRGRGRHALARSDRAMSAMPAPLRKIALRAVETAIYDWGLDLTMFGVPRDAFGSAMVTNVGMFGLPYALAPLVPFSRVPILLTVGSLHDAPVVESGAVVVRPVVCVGVTLDHRLIDGALAGRLASRFREVMLDPAAAL